jgi:hypothetical protein
MNKTTAIRQNRTKCIKKQKKQQKQRKIYQLWIFTLKRELFGISVHLHTIFAAQTHPAVG